MCSTDITVLLSNLDTFRLSERDIKILKEWKTPVKGRTYALLGQVILSHDDCASIQYRDILAIVLPHTFSLQKGWTDVSYLEDVAALYRSLPDRFDDLEDEDHDGDDEKSYHLHDADLED